MSLTVLIDGGDIYQGNAVSDVVKGESLSAAFDAMEYDAVAVGNHEFDWGLETVIDNDSTMRDYNDGYARSIRPVHTTADGDSIYAVSAGNVEADQDLVGSLSAVVMSEAIKRAVYSADSAYGFKSAKDLNN